MRHRLNRKQKVAIDRFEGTCGLDFMYIDEIDSGRMKFKEAWKANEKLFFSIYAEIQNINLSGCGMF